MAFNPFKKRATVGIALGGGGPKGLAHIGVIKRLEQDNIPIDYISGTSAGAIVGAFYAAKQNVAEIEEYILGKNWWDLLSLMTDPSLRQGLFQGKKVQGFLEGYLGKNITFESLKIPFKAVAVNLADGKSVAFHEGLIIPAILASIAIPMVFNPVKIGDAYYVDGGVTSPVPVEIARKMGADVVVGVNLNRHYCSDTVSDKLNMFQVARHSFSIMTHNIAMYEIKKADIIINPDVDHVHWKTLLDQQKKLEGIQKGQLATDEVVPSIKLLMEAKGPLIPKLMKKINSFFK